MYFTLAANTGKPPARPPAPSGKLRRSKNPELCLEFSGRQLQQTASMHFNFNAANPGSQVVELHVGVIG